MNEAAARDVLLLQAYETAPSDDALWTAEDRAWATRGALTAVGTAAPAEAFVAERARLARERLGPRGVTVPALWRPGWVGLALLLGFGAGLLTDTIGTPQRQINLLAPPVWALVLWNLVAYALMGWAAWGRQDSGWLRRRLAHALERLRPGGSASASAAFAAHWAQASAPLNGARAALLLHAAAAALAVGLLAGLYGRALVFDYRAGWQSTFLDGATVHAWLATLLAPASALTGIAVPDAATMQTLRVLPGAAASADAGPWIHLYAVTLGLVVVLPRTLLALWQAVRARRLARGFVLPLDTPYFQRLLREQRASAAAVEVRPYAHTPGPAAVLGLRTLLAGAFGERLKLTVAPTCAFGAEDQIDPVAPPGCAARIVLFDLTATPEAEQQGRFVQRLHAAAPSVPLLLLVDEAGFRRRFGAAGARHAQRRQAWRDFAAAQQRPVVFADLEQPDLAQAAAALDAALQPR